MQNHLFWAEAPDGTKEYLDPKGYVLTRAEALAARPQFHNATDAPDELTRRAKLWSVRGDVHLRDHGIETV